MELLERFFSEYIVYTKIFQWISVNVDNKFLRYIEGFTRKFMDNAPYTQNDIDNGELDILMSKSDSLKIDRKPINSGTIALVFKGKLNNNDIAVKVLRTNIEYKLKCAIANIKFLLSILRYIPFINNLSLYELFDDICSKLLEQVDLTIESKNINKMYKILKPYKISKQPKAYEELCTKNVVVMDFIDGKTIYNIDESDRKEFANNFMTLNFHLILKKFIFHLDLHSGNVLFVKEDDKCKISILDMGMIKDVKYRESNLVFDLINFVFYRDSKGIADLISEYHDIVFKDKYDIVSITKSINIEMDNHFKKLEMYTIASDIIHVLKILKSHNCKISETFNIIVLSFISTLSIVSSLSDPKTVECLIKEKINFFKSY